MSIKKQVLGIFYVILVSFTITKAQNIELNNNTLIPGRAAFSSVEIDEQEVLKVIMDPTVKLFDEPTYAKLKNFEFSNGIIEVEVMSKFLPNAPEWARGFIGVAFRVDEYDSKFESIYIRPDNGRAEDQVRRNHSTQYFAYPDFKFDKLRKEEPEKYESYSDMKMNKWIKMKIVVKGKKASLYLDGNEQPSLVVAEMKQGAKGKGSIALWVGPGTEGYFRNLKVSK